MPTRAIIEMSDVSDDTEYGFEKTNKLGTFEILEGSDRNDDKAFWDALSLYLRATVRWNESKFLLAFILSFRVVI